MQNPKSPSKLPPLSEALKSIKMSMRNMGEKKEILLTGIKDVDLKILEELNDQELFSFCLVNTEANKLCSNEVFWRNRFIKRFGKFSGIKPEKRSYKNFYLSLIKELGKEIDIQDKDIHNLVSGLDKIKGKRYEIHDNGGRPFQVFVNKEFVLVYKEIDSGEDENGDWQIIYSKFPSLVFLNPKRVFIGISPRNEMTEFSGGYGPEFDGNSILINTDDNNYVYIGSEIYNFTAKSEIVEYVSPVGNNDVPYPYAIDREGNNYLMLENVILIGRGKLDDPYQYYYEERDISKISGFKKYTVKWGNEDRTYNLSYIPNIENYLEKNREQRYVNGRLIKDEEMIGIMKRHEDEKGLESMKTFKLIDRI